MDPNTADYVVVGGGLAGCVLASRLHEAPARPSVILLEAGPDQHAHPQFTSPLGAPRLYGANWSRITKLLLNHTWTAAPFKIVVGSYFLAPAPSITAAGPVEMQRIMNYRQDSWGPALELQGYASLFSTHQAFS